MAQSIDELVKPYRGKVWRTSEDAAAIFSHVPARLTVVFMEPDVLKDHIVGDYSDYLRDNVGCIDNAGEWIDDRLVPIAAVGNAETKDTSERAFLRDCFGFLLHDGDHLLYATTDEWSRDNIIEGGLEELGLEPA